MKHVARWCMNVALALLAWHLVSTGVIAAGVFVGIVGVACALSDTWEIIK